MKLVWLSVLQWHCAVPLHLEARQDCPRKQRTPDKYSFSMCNMFWAVWLGLVVGVVGWDWVGWVGWVGWCWLVGWVGVVWVGGVGWLVGLGGFCDEVTQNMSPFFCSVPADCPQKSSELIAVQEKFPLLLFPPQPVGKPHNSDFLHNPSKAPSCPQWG